LLWQHLLFLVPLGAMAMLALSGPFRFIAVAVVIYAMAINEVTLLQFALQSARMFRPVAVSTVAAPFLFCIFVLAWHMRWQSTYREVTLMYVVGTTVALMFLLWRANPWVGSGPHSISALQLARVCVGNGWPVVMANTGVALIAFADRFAVSWAASIQEFAQYSLAASAMAVLTTAIQACSKVFFSHLASVTPERRKTIYGASARLLLIAWAILLPFYFALQLFIRHALPKYFPSLAYARIMLLGIPFLGMIQILQMSYAYLHGAQRRFLVQTVVALVFSFGVTSIVAFHVGSLRLVAAVQVAILGAVWIFNEIASHRMTNQRWQEWAGFVVVYLVAAVGYWVATNAMLLGWTAMAAYYVVIVSIIAVLFKTEVGFLGGLLSRALSRANSIRY
jgi:O-antigen/teichoic acid export membrane protein